VLEGLGCKGSILARGNGYYAGNMRDGTINYIRHSNPRKPSAMRTTLLLVVFLTGSLAQAASPNRNWSGPYSPCLKHDVLLRRGHMELGVKISTPNVILAQQFERAMDYWSEVLDMTWHEVDSDNCSVQLVDGTPELFASSGCTCTAARSQLPDRLGFQGWIAFNPAMRSTAEQMFRDSVHELGHLFGLQHNPSSASVMFFDNFDQDGALDLFDLRALAVMHKLRPLVLERAERDIELVTSKREQPHLE
jgi:hypothetical protein